MCPLKKHMLLGLTLDGINYNHLSLRSLWLKSRFRASVGFFGTPHPSTHLQQGERSPREGPSVHSAIFVILDTPIPSQSMQSCSLQSNSKAPFSCPAVKWGSDQAHLPPSLHFLHNGKERKNVYEIQ